MKKLDIFVSGDRKGLENNIRVCLSSNKCFVKVSWSSQCFRIIWIDLNLFYCSFMIQTWLILFWIPGPHGPRLPKSQEELLESGWEQHHPEDAAQTFQWYGWAFPRAANHMGQKTSNSTCPLSTIQFSQDGEGPSDQIHRPFFYWVAVEEGSLSSSGEDQCGASRSDYPQHQPVLIRSVFHQNGDHRLTDRVQPNEQPTQFILRVQISRGDRLEEPCTEDRFISCAASCTALFTTLSLQSDSTHESVRLSTHYTPAQMVDSLRTSLK